MVMDSKLDFRTTSNQKVGEVFNWVEISYSHSNPCILDL
jgi:hypothetical protein